MTTELEIVSFLTAQLPKRLGDRFTVVAQPRVSLAQHGSFIPDLLVTNTSTGTHYVVEVKGTATPTVTRTMDLPLAAEASVRRTRESLTAENQRFVLITPFNVSPSQLRDFEASHITVINGENPSDVLTKLTDVVGANDMANVEHTSRG